MSTPTPEFVKWLMLPEQKEFRERVNEEWEPKVGDWFIHPESEHIGLLAIEQAEEVVYVNKEAWQWLSSLSDLLDMIRDLPDLEWFEVEAFDGGQRWEFRGGIVGEVGQAALHKVRRIAAAELLRRLWGAG